MARTRSQIAEARERRRVTDMSLAPVPKRQKGNRRDRYRESTAAPEEDARETVLTARCNHMGIPATEAARLSMSVPMMGDPAGRAIHLGARDPEEARRLWTTFCAIDSADEAHSRRIIGQARFPKTAKIELLPERFEARADDASDSRTAEEKDADAKRRWHRWSQMIECLSFTERLALQDGLRLRCKLSEGGKLTTGGLAFVAALRVMHHMAERT